MNDEMNDDMYFKVQKTLEKQLQLLSERSEYDANSSLEASELPLLTNAMVSVARMLLGH